MKDWKVEILNALDKRAQEMREIRLYDVAKELGYNHIKTHDVEDIERSFLKSHPSYKPVKMMKNSYDSLFVSLAFTECEYESETDFLKENEPENVADRLKAISRYKGITQQVIADRIGVGKQCLNNRLQRKDLKVSEMLEIAEALECDVEIRITDKKTGKEF